MNGLRGGAEGQITLFVSRFFKSSNDRTKTVFNIPRTLEERTVYFNWLKEYMIRSLQIKKTWILMYQYEI